ncbi:MAG TPA: hypothetical protein VMX38_22225 [Verrucomicrobiae bacterium]|nr:hypothetical protein [Verrucomicrobiae bacterium]
MNWGKLKHFSLLVVAGFSIVSIQLAQASAEHPLSGTYKVLRESHAGNQVRVRLQLHLLNPKGRDLHIQRITLWEFSHPAKDGTRVSSVALHAGASADVTEEVTISRAEYELWKRGAKPRVVLEFAGPAGRFTTEVVHLERASGGKEN